MPLRSTPSRALTARTLTSVVAAAAVVAGPMAAPAAAAPTEIQILGINDFHGRLQPPSTGVGGAAQLAGAVEQYRGANPNTVFVSAGDNIGASPFVSAVQQDAPTIEALNAMDLAVSAVGNHEFDRGYDDLAGRVTDLADFPHLGANVEGESPELPEYAVLDVGGVQVGFVGVVTAETGSLVAPDGIAGITFSDPAAAINRVANQLSDGDASNGEADTVVVLAHEGGAGPANDAETCAGLAASEDAFGSIVNDSNEHVDAIIGGHTHLAIDCELPKPGGGTRVVLEAASYGTALDVLTMTIDPVTDEISAISGEVVPVTGFPSDPEVQAIVDEAVAEAEVLGQVQVGTITTDITRAFDETGEEDRGEESVLGNFIATVQLAATDEPELGGAQIAFMNPGGLRDDFLYEDSGAAGDGPGVVTYAEANTVQPFTNGVITMTLTGAQVKTALEQQWQPDTSSRPFLHLGLSEGFQYVYDPEQPRGERILSMTLDGEPLDLDETYRVTVNSFLAAGGDNFTVFTEGTDRQDNGFNDLNVLIQYFEENSPVTPATDERSIHIDDVPVEPDTVADVVADFRALVAAYDEEGLLPKGVARQLDARLARIDRFYEAGKWWHVKREACRVHLVVWWSLRKIDDQEVRKALLDQSELLLETIKAESPRPHHPGKGKS